MAYKTILVHVDQSAHASARYQLAAQIAVLEDAHLTGAAMTGLTQFIYQFSAMPAGVTALPADLDFLNEAADRALATFETVAGQFALRAWERRRIDDDPAGGLILQSRYCDLVVLGQSDPAQDDAGLAQTVMLHSAQAVLVAPYAGAPNGIGRHALLAWNGSLEASRAIAAAIPLLRRSAQVTVAVFNPAAQYGAHGEQPGADLALYLTRHGIKVDVIERETDSDVGEALLSLAADLGADLLVMGGYGHSRFREAVLGGVTKTVLARMTLPVLMAH